MDKIKDLFVAIGIGRHYEAFGAEEYIVSILLTLVVLTLLVLIIAGIYSLLDNIGAHWCEFSGKLESKQYEPPTSSTSIGMTSNGNGGLSPVVMTSSSSEVFDIFVRLQDRSIQKLQVSQQSYFDLKQGDTVVFWKKKGRLSKNWIDATVKQPKRVTG